MPNPLTIGYSPITSRIYAGRSKPLKGAKEGTRLFTGEKTDITDDAMSCVADKILKDGEPIKWILNDGRVMTMTVVISESDPEELLSI